MKNVKGPKDNQVAGSSPNSTHDIEGRGPLGFPLTAINLNPSIVENPEQDLEVLSCVTLSGESTNMSAKDQYYKSGNDQTSETKGNESPVAGQGICLGSDRHENIERDGTGAVNLKKTRPTAVGASWPDQPKRPETGSAQKHICAQVSDGFFRVDSIDPSFCECGSKAEVGMFETTATTECMFGIVPPRDRYFKEKQVVTGHGPSDPPCLQSSVPDGPSGFTEPDKTSRIHNGNSIQASNTIQQSQLNHISFKTPIANITGAESFGFPFSPRFEKLDSERVSPPRPTKSLFEDIGKQGRCSLPDYQRSAEDLRHHSRGSTFGLQSFGPLPIAMKTSKETGDHPPILSTPPYTSHLSCSMGMLYDPTGDSGGMEVTPAAKQNASVRGGLYADGNRGDKVNLGLSLEPYNMKSGSCESSFVEMEVRGGRPSNTSSVLDRRLHCTTKAGFATLGVESTWMPSRNDHEEMVDNAKEGNGILPTYYAVDAPPQSD